MPVDLSTAELAYANVDQVAVFHFGMCCAHSGHHLFFSEAPSGPTNVAVMFKSRKTQQRSTVTRLWVCDPVRIRWPTLVQLNRHILILQHYTILISKSKFEMDEQPSQHNNSCFTTAVKVGGVPPCRGQILIVSLCQG